MYRYRIIKNILPAFIVLLYATLASGQFVSPVRFPLRLTGSFGELRKNHFHTGLDIKRMPEYKKNKVYAIDSGYIYRIKVSADGYGKALYIAHPNGLTSVYAHLSKFNKNIEETVKKIQYENQVFEIYPDSLHIPVKRGQFLGYIGNTGRSFGPHLHFELRNTITEHPVNPFIYNIKSKDNRPPVLTKIKIVALDTSYNTLNSKTYNLRKTKNSHYTTKPKNISYGAWRIGIEISGFDRMNGAYNKNGIYSIKMKLDDVEVYSFGLDSLDFDKMNEINAFIDYQEYKLKKKKIIRLYKLPGLDLDILKNHTENGIINLYKNKGRKIEIIAADYDGNKSTVSFFINRDVNILESVPKLYNHIVKYNYPEIIEGDNYKIEIDKNSLFKDMYLFTNRSEDGNISIFTNYEPFKNAVNLLIKADTTNGNIEKQCLIKLNNKKNKKLSSTVKNGYFHARIKEGGVFKITYDTIAPVIKPLNFKYNLSKTPVIKFRIYDNFTSSGTAGQLIYNGYIDDKWVLFEYDKKTKTLSHRFDNNIKSGKHLLRLLVEDDMGNVNIFEKTFKK